MLWPVHTIPALEPVDEYVWLDQSWGDGQNSEQRQTYYYTAQGTSMPQGASGGALRYDWFVHLELPFSSERFANPDHMRKYRFLVDPAPSAANPDQLPIGFTKHFDPAIGEYVLDVTCAACHTGEIHYTKDNRTVAMRIDGGQAMHAFTDMSRGSFAPVLLASLVDTVVKPWKFDRFAQRVLGPGYPKSKPELKSAVWATIKAMLGSGQNNPLRKLYPVHEGFGRTDALGRIGNTAFGDHLANGNYQVGDAPVSYPYLWNIWKFDWVQYNGSVAQPLARNIGEALGVGAISPLRSQMNEPLPADHRFRSSVDIAGLQRIEHTLQQLTPPTWPEQILGADRHGQGRARLQAVRTILSRLPWPARVRCRPSAGERAAQTVPRSGMAHRSGSAGTHRHRSQCGQGLHGASLQSFDDGPDQRATRRRSATVVDSRAGARCSLPSARSRSLARRATIAAGRTAGVARELSRSRRVGHAEPAAGKLRGDRRGVGNIAVADAGRVDRSTGRRPRLRSRLPHAQLALGRSQWLGQYRADGRAAWM